MKLDIDAVIIGAGVAGLTSAIYLKRYNIDVLLLEKELYGGQLNQIYKIQNYPGFKEVEGSVLAQAIYDQVKSLEIRYENDNVIDIIDKGTYKIIKTNKKEIKCKSIILATGRIPRRIELEHEKELTGKGVSYCATCDGFFYKNKDVAVIGGGNSALEEAILLSSICNKVYMIHRKSTFSGDASLVDKVKNSKNIQIIYESTVSELISKDDCLNAIVLNNGNKIMVSGLFIYIGSIAHSNFLSNLNIYNDNGYILVDKSMRTNVPHIYACGDAIKKHIYQITTAIGDATNAANSLKEDLLS